MNSTPPPTDDVEPDGVFKFLTDASQARVQMQHKCGEVSLQVTAALGAVIAALITAFLSHPVASGGAAQAATAGASNLLSPEGLVSFIRGFLFLYAFVQTMITANYIYHTFQIHILGLIYDQLAPGFSNRIAQGIRQAEMDHMRLPLFARRFGWAFVNSCQPLIPAFSALLAWPASFYFLWVQDRTPPHWSSFAIASLGVTLLFGTLLVLLSKAHERTGSVRHRNPR